MPRPKTSRAEAIFAEHYAEHARYYGDEEPKKAAAAAKRTATGMSTAAKSFQKLLTADQQRTLAEASAVLRGLAADLDAACKMAVQTQVAFAASERKRREDAADAIASARWVDESGMLKEAADLAAFIDQNFGLNVNDWILAQPRAAGSQYAHMPDPPSPGGRLTDMLHRKSDLTVIRRRAAEYLGALQEAMRRGRRYKDSYYVALDDYEAWREWRNALLGAVMPPRSSGAVGH